MDFIKFYRSINMNKSEPVFVKKEAVITVGPHSESRAAITLANGEDLIVNGDIDSVIEKIGGEKK